MTTSYSDGSDIWEEEVNEEFTKYLVDGQWRDLVKVKEIIAVMGQPDVEVELVYTHRGLLMDLDSIRKYSPKIPRMAKNSYYSIA